MVRATVTYRVVGGRPGHLVMKYRAFTTVRMLPMAPLQLALGSIADDERYNWPELPPRGQPRPHFRNRRIRGSVNRRAHVLSVAVGSFLGPRGDGVETSSHWPPAGGQNLRTVIKSVRCQRGEKIGQARPGINGIPQRCEDHLLLGRFVRRNRRWALADWSVEERGLIGEQLQRESRFRA